MFNPYEIVLAKFPFSSLESAKRRPCLVLGKGDHMEDFIVAFITLVQTPSSYKYSIKITPGEKDFLSSGLKVESFIRVDKLATINQVLISGGIGTISPLIQNEVHTKLKLLFGL